MCSRLSWLHTILWFFNTRFQWCISRLSIIRHEKQDHNYKIAPNSSHSMRSTHKNEHPSDFKTKLAHTYMYMYLTIMLAPYVIWPLSYEPFKIDQFRWPTYASYFARAYFCHYSSRRKKIWESLSIIIEQCNFLIVIIITDITDIIYADTQDNIHDCTYCTHTCTCTHSVNYYSL